MARLGRLLQRAEQFPVRMEYGSLSIEILSGQAFLRDVNLQLAPKEFALLLIFTQHEGQMLSADYLYQKVWGQPLGSDTGALKNMMYRLRKKIEGSGYDIWAGRGHGYIFETEEKHGKDESP